MVDVATIQPATIFFVACDDAAKVGFFNLQQFFLLHVGMLHILFDFFPGFEPFRTFPAFGIRTIEV